MAARRPDMPQASRPPRFFIPADEVAPAPFAPGRELALPSTEAHHAAHVLRLTPGDAVELFDGRGASALGRVTAVRRSGVLVAVDAVRQAAARPLPALHLAFAVPKGKRLDWLLEKATELGVASLEPIGFTRSVAGPVQTSSAKRDRWTGHLIAAAKQAGLDFLPAVREPRPLDAFLAAAGPGVYGDLTDAAAPLAKAAGPLLALPALYIVVGPEGGLTESERDALGRAGLVPVRLGRATLRVETAAVALVSGFLALLG